MVEERAESAQETFPEQSYCRNSGKAGTAERCGKKEGLQNETAQVKEIPKDPWQSVKL